ncbi:homeobox-leucine zipper protein HOX13-like isoform X1 [Zingiber officinale]|uniref:Homeobox-leucine zipper protein n=1 Tax=Zingiber officinale TaxID=94328 RepID=A0A8J5KY36_ZINOF|nr:homeobox-leucine zipper protein HOX13-like isoform X1 [Zingiber officinale]KAG6497367.1 hypothetical protein ZIOFF_045266 [Zingiber officinale]
MQKLSSSYSFNVEEKGKNRVMKLDYCKTEEEAEELGEKKRRLRVEQVEALEKKLVAEEKLDPEKKQRLAENLGQQPRQMAVCFQNCRKRSKMKQRKRDFEALKARHDALKLDCDAKRRQNQALISLIRELESKLAESTGCEMETTGRLLPNYNYTDGASDTDSSTSSTLLNGEANYGDHYCLLPEQSTPSFSWRYSDMDDTD